MRQNQLSSDHGLCAGQDQLECLKNRKGLLPQKNCGARYELVPQRQDLLAPQKIMGQGTSWSQEAGSTRILELCTRKNHETLVCAEYFSREQGAS